MDFLRDDRLLCLNDLVEACRASAQQCALAAERLADDPRGRELQALAEQRSRDADTFSVPMIEADDIPGGPPEELGLLGTVLAGATAAFTDDGGAALLAECREKEKEVLRQAEAAENAPLRAGEKQIAAELAKDARARLDRLLKP